MHAMSTPTRGATDAGIVRSVIGGSVKTAIRLEGDDDTELASETHASSVAAGIAAGCKANTQDVGAQRKQSASAAGIDGNDDSGDDDADEDVLSSPPKKKKRKRRGKVFLKVVAGISKEKDPKTGATVNMRSKSHEIENTITHVILVYRRLHSSKF